jgi:hypothetical protein
MVQSYDQRYTGSEYLTGQEVSYEEIIEVLEHRHDTSSIGDNDIA